ncbi:MAG: S8 family serine peptidase, partial [Gammaproteobacteria bacterium]|nr:S8 family serine peptidase [Gammaproteobacteria bacterium]
PREALDALDALDALEDALPAAFDYNHIYDLPEGERPSDGKNPSPTDVELGATGTGRGIRLGVIDTLPNPDHVSLKNQAITIRDFADKGQRDRSHATAVVSILVGEDPAADYSGLIPGAQIYAANIFSLDKSGRPQTNAFAMIRALDWLAGENVGVINLSIAGPPSDALETVLQRLAERGHQVVAAVGNDGPAAPPLYPAAYQSVTGVTAVDLNNRPYRRANRGAHVDYAAPGVRLRAAQSDGHYDAFTGTSFATPVVSALFALQAKTASDARNAATKPAPKYLDLGEPGRDTIFGYGLIQLAREHNP